MVASGLWGVVRGGDLVPDYRVPAAGTVPGLGGVSAHWRPALAAAMPALVGSEPVLDLRSTDYRGMWRPGPDLRDQVVTVRVLAERGTGRGRRTGVVSFHAKHVKGQVVRHLVSRPAPAPRPDGSAGRRGGRAGPPGGGPSPGRTAASTWSAVTPDVVRSSR